MVWLGWWTAFCVSTGHLSEGCRRNYSFATAEAGDRGGGFVRSRDAAELRGWINSLEKDDDAIG